eukprot:3961422-Amphidinium_carterae.1
MVACSVLFVECVLLFGMCLSGFGSSSIVRSSWVLGLDQSHSLPVQQGDAFSKRRRTSFIPANGPRECAFAHKLPSAQSSIHKSM